VKESPGGKATTFLKGLEARWQMGNLLSSQRKRPSNQEDVYVGGDRQSQDRKKASHGIIWSRNSKSERATVY